MIQSQDKGCQNYKNLRNHSRYCQIMNFMIHFRNCLIHFQNYSIRFLFMTEIMDVALAHVTNHQLGYYSFHRLWLLQDDDLELLDSYILSYNKIHHLFPQKNHNYQPNLPYIHIDMEYTSYHPSLHVHQSFSHFGLYTQDIYMNHHLRLHIMNNYMRPGLYNHIHHTYMNHRHQLQKGHSYSQYHQYIHILNTRTNHRLRLR